MSRTYREPCGCKHDGARWIQMCAECAAEFQERHQRAEVEHQSVGSGPHAGPGARVSATTTGTASGEPKAAPNPPGLNTPAVSLEVQP